MWARFKRLKRWKKITITALALLAGLLLWNYKLVGYGLAQARGQWHILSEARPVEEVLDDSLFPDSLKAKLLLAQEIREFAIDSLGLADSESYKAVYDQQGKPVLWIVTACKPYALEDYKWEFPLLGGLSYKGHFKKQKAIAEAAALQAQGFDTDVGEVSAWSTLGWFDDPILSEMLNRSEGELARLIIHELTHGTLYVSGDVDFNENLATFVGDYGAYEFLAYKYGRNSEQYRDYAGGLADIKRASAHILRGANQLDSLYKGFSATLTAQEKNQQKLLLIQSIMKNADTLSLYNPSWFKKVFSTDTLPNNTFFMGYRRYRADLNQFEIEFEKDYRRDFAAYLTALKDRY